jgi:phosphoribosylaminoimidazolecarboxamide formyltransferase/IMP cyclohydrolase
MPRALISVSDKTGIIEIARGLAARGFEIVSTGGTARALASAGLSVINVPDITGVPEMMDGRVKTLHPRIHGGILARRQNASDLEAVRTHGIALIDIVIANLYPFAHRAAQPDVEFAQLLEEIDVGGPTLVRAAAKNFADVLVVVDPADYSAVLIELDRENGPTPAFRLALARKAFAHISAYDATIARTFAEYTLDDGRFARAGGPAGSDSCSFELEKVIRLRYGENPHQDGSWWRPRGAPPALTFVQGKELSYTNLLDLDAAWRIASEFTEPAGAVIKHTNPCGVATGASPADAYVRARDADSVAAYGGIVGLNRPIDVETARALTTTFIEAIVAPGVEEDARSILAGKSRMRVVTLARVQLETVGRWSSMELRSAFGGLLVQPRDRVGEADEPWPQGDFPKIVTRRPPSGEEWAALRFAWRIAGHVKSNAVVFTDARRTLAIGAGQMSRVDAVDVAVMKARAAERSMTGSVVASDAFFPFRDGLDRAAAAGATAVVQPGGSIRDADVISAADEHDLAMVFTGRRHFRH